MVNTWASSACVSPSTSPPPPPEAEKGPPLPQSPHTDGLTDLWLQRLPQHSSSNILSSKRKPGLSELLLRGGFGGLQKHWWLPLPLCGREKTDSLNESETTSLSRSGACHYCLRVLLANVLLFVSKLTVFHSPAFSVHPLPTALSMDPRASGITGGF